MSILESTNRAYSAKIKNNQTANFANALPIEADVTKRHQLGRFLSL